MFTHFMHQRIIKQLITVSVFVSTVLRHVTESKMIRFDSLVICSWTRSCVQLDIYVWANPRRGAHPLLVPAVAAQLVIQPPSRTGPLRCQPLNASLHEVQRLLPGAHLLQQSACVKPENSLEDISHG